MPKVKDLIFKYDNKLKDSDNLEADIDEKKRKKKFNDILEKFNSGTINNNFNNLNNSKKPQIIHDNEFNNKLDFWKNKIEENKIEKVKNKIEKVKIKKNNNENLDNLKPEKKSKKKKKVKSEKLIKQEESETDLEKEFEKMLKDL